MNNPIFARPRYNYDSYTDLMRLIKASGYPLIYFDEIDPTSDNTYILTMVNGENRQGWQSARARIILWDIEWRMENYPIIPSVNEIWVSDKWYETFLCNQGLPAKYVPMGSHPDIVDKPIIDAMPLFDVSMLAYMIPRRENVRHRLQQHGMTMGPNSWGLERHSVLQHTRIMLHVHQHDNVRTIAPQRMALAAAYKLPVWSEAVECKGIFEGAIGVEFYDYDNLLYRLTEQEFYRYPYRERGEALHQYLCIDNPFRKFVDAAL